MTKCELIAALRELQARAYGAEAKADRFADRRREEEARNIGTSISHVSDIARVVVLEQEANDLAWELDNLIDDIEHDRSPGVFHSNRFTGVKP